MGNKPSTSNKNNLTVHATTKQKKLVIDRQESNVLRFNTISSCWERPEIPNTSEPIKRAVFHESNLLLLTFTGKLIVIPHKFNEVETNQIEHNFDNDFVMQIEPMGSNKLLVVTRDKIYNLLRAANNIVLPVDGKIQEFCCGGTHAYLRTQKGCYVYGSNEYGQLGLGNTVSVTKFVKNETLSNMPIQNVYLAGWHGYVKHNNGTFYGIGYNVDGRLGNEGNTHVLVPTPLKHHLLGIHTLVCGGWHTLGLTGFGDVYIWGQQVDGNLGSYKRSLSFPRPILQGKGITKMFSGTYSTISVVQSIDKVYVWGREMESTPGASLGPVAFDKLNNVVDLDYVHCGHSDLVFTLSTKKLFLIKNVEKFADVTIFIN